MHFLHVIDKLDQVFLHKPHQVGHRHQISSELLHRHKSDGWPHFCLHHLCFQVCCLTMELVATMKKTPRQISVRELDFGVGTIVNTDPKASSKSIVPD